MKAVNFIIFLLFIEICGDSYTAATGQLTSPNYPSYYDNNIDCVWRIAVPSGLIGLNFSSFYTYSSSDYLQVRRPLHAFISNCCSVLFLGCENSLSCIYF